MPYLNRRFNYVSLLTKAFRSSSAMEQSVGARMSETAVAAQVAAQDDGGEAAVAASVQALNDTRVIQTFKFNNVALKWIRDSHENPRGWPTTTIVELTDTDPLQIGVIDEWNGLQLQTGRDNSMVMEANVGRYDSGCQIYSLGFQSSFRRRPHLVRAHCWKL